jgi:hypothetical protein
MIQSAQCVIKPSHEDAPAVTLPLFEMALSTCSITIIFMLTYMDCAVSGLKLLY